MKSLFAGVVLCLDFVVGLFLVFFFPLLWISLGLVERRGNDTPTKRDVVKRLLKLKRKWQFSARIKSVLIFCRTRFKKLHLAKSEQLLENSANYKHFYFLFFPFPSFFFCLGFIFLVFWFFLVTVVYHQKILLLVNRFNYSLQRICQPLSGLFQNLAVGKSLLFR